MGGETGERGDQVVERLGGGWGYWREGRLGGEIGGEGILGWREMEGRLVEGETGAREE